MSSPFPTGKVRVSCVFLIFLALLSFGQIQPLQAEEVALVGALPGDQVFSALAVSQTGGYVAWQDNGSDGSGWGISARRLDGNLHSQGTNFIVTAQKKGDQEKPQVALLKNGDATFVWQSGLPGYRTIYARFLSAAGKWITSDVRVNTFKKADKINPAITSLSNGVVVVWASFGQDTKDGNMQGVYAQRLSSTGGKLGSEFRINQFSSYNQRNPAVATLANGNFVAVWISEQQRFQNSVDAYARIFDSGGKPLGDEFCINAQFNLCANPSIAASANGSFTVVWGEKNLTGLTDSWDVWGRAFDSTGASLGDASRINTYTYGEQFAPKISSDGSKYLVVWTSLGQDGSREGIYAQFINADNSKVGSEFRVNTTTVSQQLQPSVASTSDGRFIAVWSSFVANTSFDIFANHIH